MYWKQISLITVAISLWTAENLDFNYERITEVNDSIPIIDAKAELCVTSGHADYPEIEEYHVGVKYSMIFLLLSKMLDYCYYNCSYTSTDKQRIILSKFGNLWYHVNIYELTDNTHNCCIYTIRTKLCVNLS